MHQRTSTGSHAAWLLLAGLLLTSCSDESGDGSIDEIQITDPVWVVPSDGIPDRADPRTFNDDLSLLFTGERLFFAWRAAPTPFASTDVRIQVISSPNLGATWEYETTFHAGADLRAPLLYESQGTVFLSFVKAGTDPLDYEPQGAWSSFREGAGDWSYPQPWGEAGEVPWDMAQRADTLHLTTYHGVDPFGGEPGQVEVRLYTSLDGQTWSPDPVLGAAVYLGGASEAAVEFGPDGDLWALLRNEEGDYTGFGSLLCSAPVDQPSAWECPELSDPERYDTPRMFRHGDEIYVLARRDLDGPYAQADPEATFAEQQLTNVLAYQSRPKRTALFHVDRDTRELVHILDLPSAGHTGSPAIVPLDQNTFLVGYHTSSTDDPDISWADGQMSEDGTQIAFVRLLFPTTF